MVSKVKCHDRTKFILVSPKTGPKQKGSNTKSCQGSKRNLKTSYDPASKNCEQTKNLTLCSRTFSQNDLWCKCIGTQCKSWRSNQASKAGRQDRQAGQEHLDDDDDVAGRGYPFQLFRFITIILTLQTFFQYCIPCNHV